MVFLLIFGRADAQEGNQPVMGVDLGLYSKYIWRGLVYDEDPVMQPDIWMSTRGVTLCFWGSYDLTGEDGKFPGDYHEWDVFLDIELGRLGPWSITGELFYGSFPTSSGIGSSTAEIGAIIRGNFSTIRFFWDIWQLHGVYVDYSVSHGVSLGRGILTGNATLGWGDDRHNLWSGVGEAAGLLNFQADLCYSLEIHPNLTVVPGIHYSELLQKDIRTFYSNTDKEAENLFFSLNLAYTVAP
jgi:hypothetical protein